MTDRAEGSANASGEPNYPIGSVGNALRLLLMFSERKSVRIADASREIGVARSTAHRLMQMLQHYGFVRQDPESRAYLAGPALVDVGLSVVRDIDARTAARPWMERLVDQLQDTVHLVALQGRSIIFLDSVESPRALRVGARTGMTLPAHGTASGKVLLAELSQAGLRELYPDSRLGAITTRTTQSRRRLEEELARVRAQGYATNFGESEEDVSAVAAPIQDRLGIARAALTISVPFSRLTEENAPEYAAATIEAARRVGESLPW